MFTFNIENKPCWNLRSYLCFRLITFVISRSYLHTHRYLSLKLTAVVRLCSALPLLARFVIRPRNTELMVLKKLDFPAPTGPIINIRACVTFTSSTGLNATIFSVSSLSNWKLARTPSVYTNVCANIYMWVQKLLCV